MSAHIAPLRGIGSTTPTLRDASRPAVLVAPSGWRCSPHENGSESWTWIDGGLPLVSVLVRADGMIAPPMVSDPTAYWMTPERLRQCAGAIAAICAFLGARVPR